MTIGAREVGVGAAVAGLWVVLAGRGPRVGEQHRRRGIQLRPRAVPRREPRPLPAVVSSVSLLAAGLVHGLFACGGPLVVYVLGRDLRDTGHFRATLSALWLVLNVFLVGSYAVAGTLDRVSLGRSAALLVPLVIGVALGERVHRRLDPVRFRRAVFALLLLAGLSLLVRTAVKLAGARAA